MGSWSEKIINTIDTKLEGEKDKNLRFFRIDEFRRNIARTESFSGSCPECKKMQIDIAEAVEKIDEAVKVPGRTRREYDRLIGRVAKHMQKSHGFYAPYYFTYLYSFFGIAGGAVLGYFLMQIDPAMKLEMFSIGFAAGLLPAYVLGYLKDKKIRSQKRLM